MHFKIWRFNFGTPNEKQILKCIAENAKLSDKLRSWECRECDYVNECFIVKDKHNVVS
jgi:hypothetical protein